MFNSSNFGIKHVVFVFEIQSGTGLANGFEGAWSDCLEISNYFLGVATEMLKNKMVLEQSKIIINY